MNSFGNLNLTKQLYQAIDDLGFDSPTPIQSESYPVVLSGKDVVGIAQTGTGKSFAYLLPLLKELKFSKQDHPRILILVPTRELVLQVVEQTQSLTTYMSVRSLGVYGGTNINTQAMAVAQGTDVLVATPGRLFDLAMKGVLKLKEIKKLVIDEVDVMLDLGFRHQLNSILELLPERRQNIMFSATMTTEVDMLIDDFFKSPVKISIAVSGTPLHNIAQRSYPVSNFNTKVNLLSYLLKKEEFEKVLVFVSGKKIADRLFEAMEEEFHTEICIIHSNKSQNYRFRSLQQFEEGEKRILVTTDVMARGIDIEKISHVINFDTPEYPENYMHRIGRTGRAEQPGETILFYTEKEIPAKEAIEKLMDQQIQVLEFPSQVKVSHELIPEERPFQPEIKLKRDLDKGNTGGGAFHEKKLKNTKINQGGSYLRKKKKHKKPQTRGDKNFMKRHKKR